jgi:hypothetical protein
MRRGRTHQPTDIVVEHLSQGLVEFELVAALVLSPEGYDRLQRRAAGHRAGHLRHQHHSFHRKLETPSGPTPNGLQAAEDGGIGRWFSKQHRIGSSEAFFGLVGDRLGAHPLFAFRHEGSSRLFAYYGH